MGLLLVPNKVEKKKFTAKIRNIKFKQCEYDVQSPANPPLFQPYQWYDNYEQMQVRMG